jgi:hypothetical protein
MAERTTGFISHPPFSRILMVRIASRTFKVKIKTRRRSNPGP